MDPEDIRICLTRFSNTFMCSSSTRRKAIAVRSLVCSFCRFQTPSLVLLKASWVILILGSIRTSNPHLKVKEERRCFRQQVHSSKNTHHSHNLTNLFEIEPREAKNTEWVLRFRNLSYKIIYNIKQRLTQNTEQIIKILDSETISQH